jgi:hypothetical protein
MTCNMINNKALLLTLAYVKQKTHDGIGASKGAGHFPSEHVCVCV